MDSRRQSANGTESEILVGVIRKLAIFIGFVLVGVSAYVNAADPVGDSTRRAAAELLILQGDAQRLLQADTSPLHRKGLTARLRGGLSSLGITLRQAGRPDPDAVERLRAALDRGGLDDFVSEVEGLRRLHPLIVPGILPPISTPQRLERGRAIHQATCAGCHDYPNQEVLLPARNLFDEARLLSAQEFAARLLLGVRGDFMTTLANPFSDEDIASLMAYYLHGKPQ